MIQCIPSARANAKAAVLEYRTRSKFTVVLHDRGSIEVGIPDGYMRRCVRFVRTSDKVAILE